MPDNTDHAVKTGESMACLQIAAGIWGVLLLVVPVLMSFRNMRAMAAVFILLVGTVLAFSGGVAGLKPERAARATSLMIAGDAIVTLCSLVLVGVSFTVSDVNWYFPLGAMFLTLAALSNLAGHRFRRATMTAGRPLGDLC